MKFSWVFAALLSWVLAAVAPLARSGAAPLARSVDAVALDRRPAGLEALVGKWFYAGDVTPNGTHEKRPNYGPDFSIALEGEVVVLEQTKGGKRFTVRLPLDGSAVERKVGDTTSTFRGRAEAGAWQLEWREDSPGDGKRSVSLWNFVFTPKEKAIEVAATISEPFSLYTVCLYRKEEDIVRRPPVKAKIDAVAWIAGDWNGKKFNSTIEELWSPPAGGSMLAISRTVNAAQKMTAFEYLRIEERGTTLVYVAQPGGGRATEFTLVELAAGRAVFENPLHDHPQRITYERAEHRLTAVADDVDGGRPLRFEFTRAK
ncbi:MAG: hypothetical protein JNL90_12190 [Planctomycetes bacterium]|nr:hypothetical protein [Planctomycetota bacterium]